LKFDQALPLPPIENIQDMLAEVHIIRRLLEQEASTLAMKYWFPSFQVTKSLASDPFIATLNAVLSMSWSIDGLNRRLRRSTMFTHDDEPPRHWFVATHKLPTPDGPSALNSTVKKGNSTS
jgi:hypothetical protein